MKTILSYVLGILGALITCAGIYTQFTGDTNLSILGGQMIPESARIAIQINREWAIPMIVVGLVLFFVATWLMRHRN